jgi:polyphosphate kinase 2
VFSKNYKYDPNINFEKFKEQLDNDKFVMHVYKKYIKHTQERSLKPYQAELIKMQKHLENRNEKMIILIEGRDASGKGGAIRRITRYMNEKHYRVVALGKPSNVQQSQWYFQRYVEQFPKGGEVVLFDRSWYNRAMVEPVFGFCSKEQYDTFMNSVPNFESDLVNHGFHFLKIYFSVTKEEQSVRFQDRESNPLKQWKLSEIDLQMQERWNEFSQVKYNMLKKTHTPDAPWTVIKSDNKFLARLNAIKTILSKIDYDGKNKNLDYSIDTAVVHSGATEIEIMEQQLQKYGKFIN